MSSRVTFSLTTVAVLAAALAQACASAPAETSSPSTASGPAATTLATPPSMDPELEALLPDRVGRLEIMKRSLAGLEFSAAANPSFQQFLQEIGVSGAQVSVASGIGASTAAPDAAPESSAFLLAIRVRGASPEQLVSTFRRALEVDTERTYSITDKTVSGKEVLVATPVGTDDAPAYFYARGDVMLFVAASDEALAEEAITLLP